LRKAGINSEIYEKLPEAVNRGLAITGPGGILPLACCRGMDYGASICLEKIHTMRPDLDKEKVFPALKNRVAGI